jgi:hypothetical protein
MGGCIGRLDRLALACGGAESPEVVGSIEAAPPVVAAAAPNSTVLGIPKSAAAESAWVVNREAMGRGAFKELGVGLP